MFEMDSFERELDEQNAALEAMLSELDDVNYSSSNSLLDKVQAQVDIKCNTLEACESMLNKLSNEISEYNDALQTMKFAAESYSIDGDKSALKSLITPASDAIREKYSMITMESASTSGLVSDNEVATVRNFLTGSKAIIEAKMESLNAANESWFAPEIPDEFDDNTSVIESFMSSVDSYDVATEGVKDAFNAVKEKLIKWLQPLINKFSKKASDEKDPKKKGLLSKLVSKLKSLFGKAKNAKSTEECSDIKQSVEEAMNEVDDEDDFYSAYNQAKGNESFVGDMDDRMIDLARRELDLAFESYFIAEEAFFNENESFNGINSFDEFIEVATEASMQSVERQRIFKMKYGQTKKSINATIKEAKAAARQGDYAKAISLYKKAKTGFKGLLSIAKNLPGTTVNQSTINGIKSGQVNSYRKNSAIDWVNTQISKCDLAIEKLQGKIAKQNRKAAKESFSDIDAIDELDAVIESLTDTDELIVEDLDDILGFDF